MHAPCSSPSRDCARSAGEPAGASARAEVVLLVGEGVRGLTEGAGRLRAGEEVDVHAADPSRPELDVARAPPAVVSRLLAAAKVRDDRGGDDACRAFREDARLRLFF